MSGMNWEGKCLEVSVRVESCAPLCIVCGRITELLNLKGCISLNVCLPISESTSIMQLGKFFVKLFVRSAQVKIESVLNRANYSCDLKRSYFPQRGETLPQMSCLNILISCMGFFLIENKVNPRFIESVLGNLNSVLFQEMNGLI